MRQARKTKEQFQRALRSWYRAHGRDLPWRRTRDPYAVLVAEVMLQQTQAAAVIPYFENWRRRFPDFRTLAHARERSVLHAWQGLGYYARARNLHRCAKVILARHGGKFPTDPNDSQMLPGIGRYTANAVAVFAFDRSLPIVEANTARVLARLTNFQQPIDSGIGRKKLWETAAKFVPQKNARDFQNAIIDLGALVCTSRQPRCQICPVKKFCRAPNPASLPRKRPRSSIEKLTENHSLHERAGKILLQQSTGRWRAMWILPSGPLTASEPIYRARFPFTHHLIDLQVFRQPARSCRKGERWFSISELEKIPIPSPHRRALDFLLQPRID